MIEEYILCIKVNGQVVYRKKTFCEQTREIITDREKTGGSVELGKEVLLCKEV